MTNAPFRSLCRRFGPGLIYVNEMVMAPPETRGRSTRAAELAIRHPHLASAFSDFARAQHDEYDYLDEHALGAVWAVRRP